MSPEPAPKTTFPTTFNTPRAKSVSGNISSPRPTPRNFSTGKKFRSCENILSVGNFCPRGLTFFLWFWRYVIFVLGTLIIKNVKLIRVFRGSFLLKQITIYKAMGLKWLNYFSEPIAEAAETAILVPG